MVQLFITYYESLASRCILLASGLYLFVQKNDHFDKRPFAEKNKFNFLNLYFLSSVNISIDINNVSNSREIKDNAWNWLLLYICVLWLKESNSQESKDNAWNCLLCSLVACVSSLCRKEVCVSKKEEQRKCLEFVFVLFGCICIVVVRERGV